MNYKSQLGYIMDLIELTGKDLATAINVDRTLVSKWKNNARPFSSSSVHFKNLVEALIFFNSRRKDSTLERFFGKVYPKEDKNEPEYLEVCLTLWLIGKDLGNFNNLNDWRTSKSALYSANIEIYQGNVGKRHALLDFFEYALSLPPGQEIFISDLEEKNWLIEDPEFYNLYYKKYYEIIEMGHNVTVIHNLAVHKTDPNAIDTNRFRSYFTGRITSYYSNRTSASTTEPSVYIIHRHMSLLSMSTDNDSMNRYIAINRDPFSVQHMVNMFISRMRKATKMVSTFSAKGGNLKGFLDDTLKNKTPSNIYYTAPQVPLVALSKEVLEKILIHNNVQPELIHFVEIVRVQNQMLLLKNVNTNYVDILLDNNAITDSLSADEINLNELSSICQTPINVDHSLYLEILQSAFELGESYKHINVSVVPFDSLPILKDAVLWMFEDQVMYSILLKYGEHFVVSDAPIILDTILNLIQHILMENENAPPLIDYI